MRNALVLVALAGLGCGLHEVNNDRGGAINLALHGDFVLVARGKAGLDVVRADDGTLAAHVDPEGAADSYDDVTTDRGIVIVHDADDGLVSSFRLADDGSLGVVTENLAAESGPYSGVSMSEDVAVVSGGTCGIVRLSVGDDGQLAHTGTLEGFRGHPDVSLGRGLGGALLSTHFSGDEDEFVDGQEFGVSTLDLAAMKLVASVGLPGAGFTAGGGRPASWPVRAGILANTVIVASGGGLDLLEVGDGLEITKVAHLDLPFIPIDVMVTSLTGHAVVVGIEPPTLAAVDITPDGALVLDATFELPPDAEPTAVAAHGNRIFVADNRAGLLIRER